MSFEPGVVQALYQSHSLLDTPRALLLEHFIEDSLSDGHYTEGKKLTESDLKLLQEILWFTANITATHEEITFKLLHNGFAQDLQMLAKCYHD